MLQLQSSSTIRRQNHIIEYQRQGNTIHFHITLLKRNYRSVLDDVDEILNYALCVIQTRRMTVRRTRCFGYNQTTGELRFDAYIPACDKSLLLQDVAFHLGVISNNMGYE